MRQNLVVQKYGGTSVANIERIKAVVQIIMRTRAAGKNVLVVVSAMAGETNRLLALSKQLSDCPDRREIDLLLSSGERVSSALLSIALRAAGCPAVSLTGRQMGLVTDNIHTRARIKHIDTARVKKILKDNHVVVCAGFQGISEDGDVTTLGRGGSDTSAVALAVALNATACEIYTDVKGIYTADPRLVPSARKLDMVSFDEMLEMASLGAGVLHTRCVEFAKNFNMPVCVRSSSDENDPGTWIGKEDPQMEQPVVSGVMVDKNQAKITVKGVPDQPGIAANIFGVLADRSLSVDMIIQNISDEGHTDISFTLPTTCLSEALPLMEKIAKKIKAQEVASDSNIAKVSIVGAGMKSHSGVAARMFKALSRESINLLMISTSEIRVSCVIRKNQAKLAVQALHAEFDLKNDPLRKSKPRKVKPRPIKKKKALAK